MDMPERARPFDPRLWRRVPAVRAHLVILALLGGVAAAIIIGQASALAWLLTEAAAGQLATTALVATLAAVAARAGWVWLSHVVAARAAARIKQQLRSDLFATIGRRGPSWLSGQRAGELATLTGRGLDGLDGYLTGYLPQLVLSVTVPLAVLAQLVLADWSSAAIVAVTLPLLPIFGALVGWQTRAATRRQWQRLSRLGGHVLDLVSGLATLRVFGRAHAQVAMVRRLADQHRSATMRTLRVAFLSALVLELVAALAVALVAVPIGLRLLGGLMDLRIALLVLLLVPEAFLPLRAAGAKFHASAEGVTVLDDAFRLIDAEQPQPRPAAAPTAAAKRHPVEESGAAAAPASRPFIHLDQVTVAYPRTVALAQADLTIAAGERVALIGPSGAGKSTLLGLLLGFVTPTAGRIRVGDHDLSEMDTHLFAASLADNIRLGAPEATDEQVRAAARAAQLDDVIAELPDGLDTMLGAHGVGLSSGQRQRVALARAFLRDAPLLLLDEPTARLDPASEAAVADVTAALVAGRTTVLVAHRPALLRLADRVVRVDDGRLREVTRPSAPVSVALPPHPTLEVVR
jgi:ATP-binding cassette subfamily C protein CydD